jgi:hypothetical protein
VIKETVLERIHSVMAEHGSVKVNTTFNGEFVAGNCCICEVRNLTRMP